jgi:hypothetical protein
MSKILYLSVVLLLCVPAARLSAHDDLNQDQLKLLQDPDGWEYIEIDDSDAGIQTQHTCFDGTPHPDVCSGTLTLSSGNTFVQEVNVHHQSVSRRGTYSLDGDQLAFFDEFGTKDGPYTVAIDPDKTSLSLRMPQVHMELLLKNRKSRE